MNIYILMCDGVPKCYSFDLNYIRMVFEALRGASDFYEYWIEEQEVVPAPQFAQERELSLSPESIATYSTDENEVAQEYAAVTVSPDEYLNVAVPPPNASTLWSSNMLNRWEDSLQQARAIR